MTPDTASTVRTAPPDQDQREAALNPRHSVIVQAPAGSGKTDLLTRRFLRLLAEVEDPAHIVAITFTKAAAAEMRHRILAELEKAAEHPPEKFDDEFSMQALAARALRHAEMLDWDLLNSPAQLRISTIDSFGRELAIQQPLVSGFPGSLNVTENAFELYRKAARRTLERIEITRHSALVAAIEDLLTWRDNNWNDVESQLAAMLAKRDKWMHGFVLKSEQDWDELRQTLEAPFSRAVSAGLAQLTRILSTYPDACAEAHALARFACEYQPRHRDLAELADFPCGPFDTPEELEAVRCAFLCLANMLLTGTGEFRAKVDKSIGFPASSRRENERMRQLIEHCKGIPGLREALRCVQELPPARYTEDEWRIVRACFVLLRHAAAELRIVLEEAGVVDFIEIAQRAQLTLLSEDGLPTEAGFAIADRIHHLLVDEFQDTSRRQHKLITSLVKAWPDTADRTVFVVGDPMQSIYFFRDAEAELFVRVRNRGLELEPDESLTLHPAYLKSNFRTAATLVEKNNEHFERIFGEDDGSGITFSASIPARAHFSSARSFSLHLDFMPESSHAGNSDAAQKEIVQEERDAAHERQTSRIVALVRAQEEHMLDARARGGKHRVAVLARTKNALAPIASALRDAGIRFRAVDLEPLGDRPEVRDVLALARAILNAEDRVAWLSVLRAPWCGLRADELHALVSADDPEILLKTVPELIELRSECLNERTRADALRMLQAIQTASRARRQNPSVSLGTWLRAVWESLGGDRCVDATAAENLEVLWDCLDDLPGGELDLLGEGLQSKLARLTAQPDPEAESDVGVQLMSIHKSKGLEFEVVVVPELQAGCGGPDTSMLSWLERGLVEPEAYAEPTEFLIAPRQSKGRERGDAKAWVDAVRRQRERQEMRRILYVAATRAREELHFFARPEFKADRDSVSPRSGTLLETAWPAIEAEVQREFAAWIAGRKVEQFDLAAEAKVLTMPSPARAGNKSVLMRLPTGMQLASAPTLKSDSSPTSLRTAYERHKGGIPSRAIGTAVHMLLEQSARLRRELDWSAVKSELVRVLPAVIARQRSAGLSRQQAQRSADEALAIAHAVLDDRVGAWLLSPHAEAESEAAWTSWSDGNAGTVRVDRVFRAGTEPLAAGDNTWWIVDYKTAHLQAERGPDSLPNLRKLFEAQLNTYAGVLRSLRGAGIRIHAGLYYPRVRLFDWWQI